MPSTYSPSLRLELIGAGEQAANWNNTTNYNLGTLLEQAISGVENVAISGTSYTLTTGSGVADQARNAVINLTGTLSANCDVIVPSADKVYIIRNSTTGGFSVVVKTAAGSGVTVANGNTQIIYCDATNVVASGPAFNATTDNIISPTPSSTGAGVPNLSQVQGGSFLWGGTAGGTANALTINLSPPIAAYAGGQQFRFLTNAAANSSAVTLNINGLGAVALNKGNGTVALIAGDLPASSWVEVGYDGVRFRLLSVFGAPPTPTSGNWFRQFYGSGVNVVLPGTGSNTFAWFLLERNTATNALTTADMGVLAGGSTIKSGSVGFSNDVFMWRTVG